MIRGQRFVLRIEPLFVWGTIKWFEEQLHWRVHSLVVRRIDEFDGLPSLADQVSFAVIDVGKRFGAIATHHPNQATECPAASLMGDWFVGFAWHIGDW